MFDFVVTDRSFRTQTLKTYTRAQYLPNLIENSNSMRTIAWVTTLHIYIYIFICLIDVIVVAPVADIPPYLNLVRVCIACMYGMYVLDVCIYK